MIAPDGWKVISNMAPDVAAEPAGPGIARWHFPPTPVMSTYITAIAAGPYAEVRAEHDGIPLGVYCRQSLAQYLDADEIFEITRQGFRLLPRTRSACATRSASTTSCSSPSSRPARWRTPAA